MPRLLALLLLLAWAAAPVPAAAAAPASLPAAHWWLENRPLYPGGPSLTGTVGADVNAPEAWRRSRGEGVVVAVIDSGVDLRHPELAGALWRNPGERAGNGRDDDRNGIVDDVNGADFTGRGDGHPQDALGHGTHVAGLVAAADDGRGVTGLAPAARLMAVRVLDARGRGGERALARAVRYAVDGGARVINISAGSYWGTRALRAAFRHARANDVLVVGAAGNAREDLRRVRALPASLTDPNVVAVAATDADDRLAAFSARGPAALAAPGDMLESTEPGNRYGWRRGTSQAAPLVAAAAALVRSAAPSLTAPQVRAALIAGAARPPGLAGVAGRLDAAGALAAAGAL